MKALVALLLLAIGGLAEVKAETPEEWIRLGVRVHGSFGSLVPVGIRIGVDARERLSAGPRELAVVYYSGTKAPCPCIADGIMIATSASPGQGTLRVETATAPPGALAYVIIRHRTRGVEVHYTVSDGWLPKLLEWNKTLDPTDRYEAVMAADKLFEVTPISLTRGDAQ